MNDGPTPWVNRLFSLAMALGSGGVLAAATWLDPAPQGHGTHLQLGLGRCTFLALTGQPCPMCGMTTTFALMAEGSVPSAVVNQPFGVVLFLGTVAVFGLSLAELVQPRNRWRRLFDAVEPIERRLALLFVFGLLAGWAYKIATWT